jgi:hypothetical protein
MRRRLDLGMQRAALAPKLTGEQIAELLALAEMTICCGGSLTFNMRHREGECATLIEMGLAEATRPAAENLTAGTRKIILTKLGWLTLLTRCEAEMAAILPAVDNAEGEAA